MKGTIYYNSIGSSPVKNALVNDAYYGFGAHSVRGENARKDLNYGIIMFDASKKMGKESDLYIQDFAKDREEMKRFFSEEFKSDHCLFFSYEDYERTTMSNRSGEDIQFPLVVSIDPTQFPDKYNSNLFTYFIIGKCLPGGTKDLEAKLKSEGFKLNFADTTCAAEELLLIDFVMVRENYKPKMEFRGTFDGIILEVDERGDISSVYMISTQGTMNVTRDNKYVRAVTRDWASSVANETLGNRIICADSSGYISMIEMKFPSLITTILPVKFTVNKSIIDHYEDPNDEQEFDLSTRRVAHLNIGSAHYPPLGMYGSHGEYEEDMGFVSRPTYPRTTSYRSSKIPEDNRVVFRAVFKQKLTNK